MENKIWEATNKVLFVDDSATNREALFSLFSGRKNMELIIEEDPEAAFKRAKEETRTGRPIDLFILDIEMEPFNGIELANRLKKIAQYNSTPILFFTSTKNEATLIDAFEIGDEVINKRCLSELSAKVKSYLSATDAAAVG